MPRIYFRRRIGRLAALILVASGPLAQEQPAYSATVNPELVLVTQFDGWGTSLCWWANVTGGYSNRSNYAALAFSTLKLNIVRYNIGGGENPGIANTMEYRARMPGFQPSPGVWDWNADQNQRWMLHRAIELGADRVVAFANSPPWWMTVSGSVTGSANGTSNNLDPAHETNFVNYLATVVSNLTELDGVHFDFVTPINEPTAGWWTLGGRQEGCHTDATQQARIIASLRPALDARNISAGIDASEDSDEQSAINSLNGYGAGQSNVALIATHTYGANNPIGIRNLAAALNKPLWISEYGDGDASGMQMARRIRNDITGTYARAWVYWQVVDKSGGWGFLYNPLDAGGDTAYSLNKKFYVMGQFSQFIRPGFQILSVDDNTSLAAYQPTNQTLIIVAVNDSTNAFDTAYDLGAFATLPANASAVRTSPTENQAALSPFAITNSGFTANLAARSVTTFILTNTTAGQPGASTGAWYPLEGNAQDASGNGNHGTLSNVVFVAGKLGSSAAQFNGSNSFISIPRTIAGDFTIAFWLKTTNTAGGSQWWGGKGLVDGEVQGAADDFGVSLIGSRVGLGAGTPDVTVTSTNSVNDGLWHHVAATRNAATGEQLVYVDGALQASGFGPVGLLTAPPGLRIGGIQAGYAGGFFDGSIDDVQIFGRVFAASEINQLLNHAPAFSAASNSYTLLAGRTLTVTNLATDPDLPAQSLSWSLLPPPVGGGINSTNGIFTWRPSIAPSPSTNLFRIQVADNGAPAMMATQSFTVITIRPPQPLLTAANPPAVFSLQVSGDPGSDYIVQRSTNLNSSSNWISVFTNFSASPPFEWTDPAPPAAPEKFYRVLLGP